MFNIIIRSYSIDNANVLEDMTHSNGKDDNMEGLPSFVNSNFPNNEVTAVSFRVPEDQQWSITGLAANGFSEIGEVEVDI